LLKNFHQEFLGFVPCKNGVSGEAIANTIQDFLRIRRLPIDDCRGQGYDGAGNMVGDFLERLQGFKLFRIRPFMFTATRTF
jgi:hypothetical protein